MHINLKNYKAKIKIKVP